MRNPILLTSVLSITLLASFAGCSSSPSDTGGADASPPVDAASPADGSNGQDATPPGDASTSNDGGANADSSANADSGANNGDGAAGDSGGDGSAACGPTTLPTSCGPTCFACPTPSHANPTCDGTSCGFQCQSGWGDCDGNPSNGCEVALTSPQHCGTCARDCLGGACGTVQSPGVCQAAALTSTLGNAQHIVVDEASDTVYVTATSFGTTTVYSLAGHGTGQTAALFDTASGTVGGLVQDSQHLFWTDSNKSSISAALKSTKVVTPLTSPQGDSLAIGGFALYLSGINGGLYSIPTTGGVSQTYDNKPEAYVAADANLAVVVRTASIEGFAGNTFPAYALTNGGHLTLDAANLYFVDQSGTNGYVYQAPRPALGGSLAPQSLVTVPVANGGVGFVAVNPASSGTRNVYWVTTVGLGSGATSTISAVPIGNFGGSQAKPIATSQPGAQEIAVTGKAIYWTTSTGVMVLAK